MSQSAIVGYLVLERYVIAPHQLVAHVVVRPVRKDKVAGLVGIFMSDGYMSSSANIVIKHLTGDLGSPEATYGIVDGHHRWQAVLKWIAEHGADHKVTFAPTLNCSYLAIDLIDVLAHRNLIHTVDWRH
jgi:hypothetical protein